MGQESTSIECQRMKRVDGRRKDFRVYRSPNLPDKNSAKGKVLVKILVFVSVVRVIYSEALSGLLLRFGIFIVKVSRFWFGWQMASINWIHWRGIPGSDIFRMSSACWSTSARFVIMPDSVNPKVVSPTAELTWNVRTIHPKHGLSSRSWKYPRA